MVEGEGVVGALGKAYLWAKARFSPGPMRPEAEASGYLICGGPIGARQRQVQQQVPTG